MSNPASQPSTLEATGSNDEEAAEINIAVDNIMCTFSAKSHLHLKHIAQHSWNIEHNLEKNVIILQLRKPRCSAILRNTGNITCTGCDNEASAYKAARRIVRIIQRAGYRDSVQLRNFRINNIHATTSIPSRIDLLAIKRDTPDHEATYEPELGGSGLTYRVNVAPVDASGRQTNASHDTKQNPFVVTFNIHHTGSIGIFGRNMRLIEEACGRLFEKLQNYLTSAASDENENDRQHNSLASKRGTASSQAQGAGAESGAGAGKARARGRRAPRRSRALRKLLGPAPASDAEDEDEYGTGRLAARSRNQRSARSQATTTSSASRKRQYVGLLDYERSESSEGDTPSADTFESEEEEEEDEETEEEDEIEFDDESSSSIIDVDDDDDEGGPPPPFQPRPRRAVERSWQLTSASQASAAGASNSASASATATASHPIIARIDRSQSQSGSSVSGAPRPVLQFSPASASLPSISYSSQPAPPRTVANANANANVNPSRQQVSVLQSQSQVVGPRVLVSPAKQAPSRPALAVSQPQSQQAPSSRSSGYSILTIVPSAQRRVAPAPRLPALPAAAATTYSQSSASASAFASSAQVCQPQPHAWPVGASQSAHTAGSVRPASSFTSSQPSTQSRLVAPVPGSTPSPIVRLAHPSSTLQRTSTSAASSAPNLATGSIQQQIALPARSRKRLANAVDDDLTSHH